MSGYEVGVNVNDGIIHGEMYFREADIHILYAWV